MTAHWVAKGMGMAVVLVSAAVVAWHLRRVFRGLPALRRNPGAVLVPGAFVGFLLTLAASPPMSMGWETRHWVPTPGTIVFSRVVAVGWRPEYQNRIAYRYVVDGKAYEGNVIQRLHLGERSLPPVQAVQQRFPAGAEVPVYHDPQHPEAAVLERGVPRFFTVSFALGLFLVIFCTAGLLIRSRAAIALFVRVWLSRKN